MFTFDHDMELSEEICELIGAYIGDGHLNIHTHGRTYILQFSGNSDLDLDYYETNIIPIIKRLFNKSPGLVKVKNSKIMRLNCYSKEIGLFLKDRFNLTLGAKTHIVKIPDEIINSDKKYIYATIRGIFDTDGCVFLDKRKIYRKPYPRITLQTVSGNLYKQLKEILSNEFKLFTRVNKKRKIYCLEIYGHQQINKWMSLIGFSNKRHLDRYAPVAQLVEHKI